MDFLSPGYGNFTVEEWRRYSHRCFLSNDFFVPIFLDEDEWGRVVLRSFGLHTLDCYFQMQAWIMCFFFFFFDQQCWSCVKK